MAQVIKIRRSNTPNTVPAALAEGELAAGLADVPIRMWIGTPAGPKELFAGAAVEDAEDDAVYGRCNGEWVEVPIVSATAPTDPAPNSLWFNSVGGGLFLWFDDGSSQQWIEISGSAGPQGPPGPAGPMGGTFPDAPQDGRLYARIDGSWASLDDGTY